MVQVLAWFDLETGVTRDVLASVELRSLSRFKIGELTMLLSSDVENLGGLWSGLV